MYTKKVHKKHKYKYKIIPNDIEFSVLGVKGDNTYDEENIKRRLNMDEGMIKVGQANNSTFHNVTIGDKQLTSFGSYDKFMESYQTNPEAFNKIGITDPKDIININGNAYMVHNRGFMDTYGKNIMTGINTGVGLANLGISLANFGTQKRFMKAQTGLAEEQLNEAKNEYSRISKLRKAIAAKYSQ